MKKNLLFGALMLSLLAGVSSCSNDEVADNNGATGKRISITAGIANGAESRVAYDDKGKDDGGLLVSWSTSETFKMYRGESMKGSLFSKDAEGDVFTGDVPTDGDGTTYYGVYPSYIPNESGALTIDLANQIGTADPNGITELMVAKTTDLDQTMTFAHKLAVLKLTLTLPGDVTGTVSNVSISGMHNNAGYKLGDANPYSYTDENKGEIVATGKDGNGFAISENKITAYIAVFPETVEAGKVCINAQAGDRRYIYYFNNGNTLVAGKVIPVTLSNPMVGANFKKEYAKSDYYLWDAYCGLFTGSSDFGEGNYGYNRENAAASHSCASCPTARQMVKYLNAGYYWDDGSVEVDGLQEYTAPTGDGNTQSTPLHKGLWLLKKAYIDGFDNTEGDETFYEEIGDNHKITAANAASIRTGNEYFFLPAAGGYNFVSFIGAGSTGCYWSSTPYDDVNSAYNLYFGDGFVRVLSRPRAIGYLPLVAE